MRRGEIQSLRWRQIDFLKRTLMVGTTKTDAGTGRVIPLNERALMTLQAWATNFTDRQPEHFVFPSEHYGLAGNERMSHAKTMDPNIPAGEIKTAWEAAKAKAGVESRFHDLRHTACTRLLERGASLSVVASIMGWSASKRPRWQSDTGTSGTMCSAQRSMRSFRCGQEFSGRNPKPILAPIQSVSRNRWAQNWAQRRGDLRQCTRKSLWNLARPAGLEPATSWFVVTGASTAPVATSG